MPHRAVTPPSRWKRRFILLLAVNLLQWWTANRHKNDEPLEVAASKASGATT